MFSASEVLSTSGGYHKYIGGYHEYIGGYHEYIGGYHEYIRGTMSTSRDIMSISGFFSTTGDIMMHVGEQGDKSLSIYIENPDVLNIP